MSNGFVMKFLSESEQTHTHSQNLQGVAVSSLQWFVPFCCLLFLLSHGFAAKLQNALLSFVAHMCKYLHRAQQKKIREQFLGPGNSCKNCLSQVCSSKREQLAKKRTRSGICNSGDWDVLSVLGYCSDTHRHTLDKYLIQQRHSE